MMFCSDGVFDRKNIIQYLSSKIRCRKAIILFLMLSPFLLNSLSAYTIDRYHGADTALIDFVSYEGFHGNYDGHFQLKEGARLGKLENGKRHLRLEKNAYVELSTPDDFSTKKGTISIWVKPFWSESEKESHTIASMRWTSGSYMVLSQGWWEPEGKNRLYFILSNQDYIHCSSVYSLQPDIWSMITVTWSTGDNGFCELYVNDERIARSNASMTAKRMPKGNILIGSDSASTLSTGRKAKFDLFGIDLINRQLLHAEIYSRYSSAIKLQPYLKVNRWKHLESINRTASNHQQIEKPETRVIFDEVAKWAMSRSNTDEILERIYEAGFNVYVPCVWHGKGTYYPTDVAHVDKRIQRRITSGDDPLKYLIQKAHALGIEVHPWFTVVKREDDTYPMFYDEGTPMGAYNIHKPEFRKFIVELMLEVEKEYDIDGINLDYIRAMGVCTSDYCANDYKRVYDKSLKLDYYARIVSGASRGRIQKWQDNAIYDIVKQLASNLQRSRSKLLLSVDAHPVVNDSERFLEGLDTIELANSGLIDVIYNMDYKQIINIENIDNVRSALKQPDKLVTLFGNYERIGEKIVSRDPMLINKYIDLVRSRWPGSGVAFYFYTTLDNEQVSTLSQGPFKVKVKPKPKLISEGGAIHNGNRL